MAKCYSVKAGPVITRIRQGQGTRRRGGVEFSATARIVSTSGGPGVIEISKEELEAILADDYLLTKEVDRPESEPSKKPEKEPAEATAKDLQAKLTELEDPSEVQAILDAEKAGKERKTVVEAAEARLRALAEAKESEPKPEEKEPSEASDAGDELPKWPLRMEPGTYLERHPDGDHAELARKIVAAEEATE